MPNVEHDTLARGRKTMEHVKLEINRDAGIMACGVVLALFSLYSAYTTPLTVIRGDGKIESTC